MQTASEGTDSPSTVPRRSQDRIKVLQIQASSFRCSKIKSTSGGVLIYDTAPENSEDIIMIIIIIWLQPIGLANARVDTHLSVCLARSSTAPSYLSQNYGQSLKGERGTSKSLLTIPINCVKLKTLSRPRLRQSSEDQATQVVRSIPLG
jgi:hypothetical protein